MNQIKRNLLLLFLVSVLATVLASVPTIEKCKQDDAACINKSAQSALKQILSGVPELEVESSDPLYMDVVNGDIAGLKYDFDHVTANGFKNCDIKNVKLELQKSKLFYDLYCKLDFTGNYILSGRLLVVPVEGKGKFSIDAKKIYISVDADLKQSRNEGKNYVTIKQFKITNIDAVDRVVFKLENLFNGNKQLSDGVHSFANMSYREVTKELSSPLFNASLKKITKNVNKYLKFGPFDDLII